MARGTTGNIRIVFCPQQTGIILRKICSDIRAIDTVNRGEKPKRHRQGELKQVPTNTLGRQYNRCDETTRGVLPLYMCTGKSGRAEMVTTSRLHDDTPPPRLPDHGRKHFQTPGKNNRYACKIITQDAITQTCEDVVPPPLEAKSHAPSASAMLFITLLKRSLACTHTGADDPRPDFERRYTLL